MALWDGLSIVFVALQDGLSIVFMALQDGLSIVFMELLNGLSIVWLIDTTVITSDNAIFILLFSSIILQSEFDIYVKKCIFCRFSPLPYYKYWSHYILRNAN